MRLPSGVASASVTALGAGLLALACSPEPRIEERPVVVYSPRECPVFESEAYSVIYGAGDFEPSIERPPIASVFLRDLGQAMVDLPKETRSLVVDIAQRDSGWRGVADVFGRGPINVLVWPTGNACRLSRDVERRTAMTLGVAGRHFIVAGGRSLASTQVPHTYVGDLTTGVIEKLEFGLTTRRDWPTITAFPSPSDPEGAVSALVAGGEDPDTGNALQTAEIYRPRPGARGDIGDFDREQITLSEPRARHAAVTLATGETLLVGGVGAAGAPLATMEIIDPVARRARTAGVARLSVPRREPRVIRLANGEILVSGGIGPRGPVTTLEWFAPDASRPTKRPVDLVLGRERAIVPLVAGGALAVIAPEPGSPTDFATVWVISADGTLEPALPVDPETLDVVRLFPGAEGAPVLWTGRRWMRWSPWYGAFEPIAEAPDVGPSLDAIATGDPGLALWLEDGGEAGMRVAGFRFATRTRFGAVPKPLLVTGPEQLAPDRLAGFPGGSIRFEAERGLLLGPGASAFLTDVDFADFELSLDVTAGPPSVVLRLEHGAELEVGGAACAFAHSATQKLAVRRRGRRVDVSVDDGPFRSCPTELERDGRVSVGLRGSQGVGLSGARNLVVTRR